ncbi:hypothetical protein BKA61DRAFT_681892 [Leptodontidium sp. MPI-SDFR-AT-0119]|nr:hypothetical protein BKA61DRAFT_681892 [Leptodontidium sp. MPI-SDFR-AT-0119]
MTTVSASPISSTPFIDMPIEKSAYLLQSVTFSHTFITSFHVKNLHKKCQPVDNTQPHPVGHLAGRDIAREGQEGHGDAPFNILCHAAAGLRYMQNVAYRCDGATFQEDASSHSITKLSESFEETQNSAQSRTSVEMLVRDAKMSPGTPLLLPSGAQLQAVATCGAEAPQVGTGNALGKHGSVGLNKRRRE